MSSDLAKWYHSMTFTYANEWDDETKKHGTVNTWDDWHLIPTSRPVFNPPSMKTVYIDIPGSDGIIDLTESLNGYTNFNNREGSVEFIVANGYRSSWAAGYSKFSNWLHGKRLRVVLDDDPNFFYEGRFSVNEWKSNNDGTWSNITFDYNLKPYKYAMAKSTEPWLWDPFNFETDIIYDGCDNIVLNRHVNTLTVTNNRMHVIPSFVVSSNATEMTIAMGDTAIIFSPPTGQSTITGTFRDPRLELVEGDNTIIITLNGTGTVSVDFRGGSL